MLAVVEFFQVPIATADKKFQKHCEDWLGSG